MTSTTGTSALLLGGVTLHSYLGIGLGGGTAGWIAGKIMSREYLKKRWKELDILVIDEISMLNPELFDKLNKIARIVRCSQKPWGGIQLLLSGDFLQLPVVSSDKFTFQADTWSESVEEIIILTENVRQQDDSIWKSILSEIRMGNVSHESARILKDRVGAIVGSEDIIPTKIFSHNMQVDKINDESLDKLVLKNPNLEFMEYNMTFTKVISKKVDENTINQIKNRSIAPDNLQLCIGAQVMLIINKPELNLANGSRGVVTDFSDEDGMPMVKFINGKHIKIETHDFNIMDSTGLITEFILGQVPLKIAYAISIHRSQGITLDCAEVDIRSCFCPGQAYVALSRVKSISGLSIIRSFNSSSVVADPTCLEFYN